MTFYVQVDLIYKTKVKSKNEYGPIKKVVNFCMDKLNFGELKVN
jgi:hypothetical protein